MRNQQSKENDIESIAEQASKGNDVSRFFTNKHVAKQRVNVDFPLTLLKMIDKECSRVGIARQAWVKMVCDERVQRDRYQQHATAI